MSKKAYKVFSLLLCFCLISEQSGFAQLTGILDISGYFAQLHQSLAVDKFRPLHLRYLQYLPNQNNFRLLIDKGDFVGTAHAVPVINSRIEDETKTLLNYFFVGLTLPNDSFWVNLRPDSPDNIIDPYLAQTDVGKILLEADLQLKKDTARFTSPDTPEGREYWDKLYQKAGEIFGSENITIPTLTRPWIVPDEIIIREAEDNAYIYKATLKVMLEQDYLKDSAAYSFKDDRLKVLNEYSSQLIRESIIPKLTKEINSAKRYAPLRQVYYSLILAQWFKRSFQSKAGFYSQLIDRKDLTNLSSQEPYSKETYFQAYQKSFKNGEYNIKEPRYTPYGQTIRSYFSGGIELAKAQGIGVNGDGPLGKWASYLARVDATGAFPPSVREIRDHPEFGPDTSLGEVHRNDNASMTTATADIRYHKATDVRLEDISRSAESEVNVRRKDEQPSKGRIKRAKENKSPDSKNPEPPPSAKYGGKGVGLIRLKALADKIGFRVPDFEILDTATFDAFQRQKMVKEINILEKYQNEIAQAFINGYRRVRTKEEKESALRNIESKRLAFLLEELGVGRIEDIFIDNDPYSDYFKYDCRNTKSFIEGIIWKETGQRRRKASLSKDIRSLIAAKISGLKDRIKVRSSGAAEDSFMKSLAGRYKSLTVPNKSRVAAAVLDVYTDFLIKRESPEDKIAVILQDFVDADSGGIAFSSLLGMTTIEAVIGSPESAVKGGSSVVIDMDGNDISEITYGFSQYPEEFVGDGYYTYRTETLWAKKTHMVDTKNSGRKRCPLGELQIKEVNRVVKALEKELGYPVDIEFAFKRNQLYVLQVRPITGRDKGLADPLPRFAETDIIAKVPIAINATDYVGRLVIIEHLDSTQTQRRLEELQKKFGKDLILVTQIPQNIIYDTGLVKVMIDPYGANRVDHQGIALREGSDTAYLGCPGILPILEEKIPFEIIGRSWKGWHGETHANVKLAKESVRIISNGLRAIIVRSDAMPFSTTRKNSASYRIPNTGSNVRNRGARGRFANEEGKSPEDMVKILYDSELRNRPFIVKKYRELWSNKYNAVLPEGTAYSDLSGAIKKGWIEKVDGLRYQLTPQGIAAAPGFSSYIELAQDGARAVPYKRHNLARGATMSTRNNDIGDWSYEYYDKFDIRDGADGVVSSQGTGGHYTFEENTSLNEVEEALSISILDRIRQLDHTRKTSQRPDVPITILDWGCGDGTALFELSVRLKNEGISNVRLIGFSGTFYKKWNIAGSDITFVWDTLKGFPLYFAEQEIDFVYSHYGLYHIDGSYPEHFTVLRSILKPNAEIVANFTKPGVRLLTEFKLLEPSGLKIEVLAEKKDYSVCRLFVNRDSNGRGLPSAAPALSTVEDHSKRDLGSVDGSTGLPSTPTSEVGGIDFRTLPVVTQAISNLGLDNIPLARMDNINLENDWSEIERLVNARITPSPERIKEYVQASCYQRRIAQDKQKVISCISDTLRQQEQSCDTADPVLLDILLLLELSRSVDNLKAIFSIPQAP